MTRVKGQEEDGLFDVVWHFLRPAAIIVLIGSALWLLVNPPSFSGLRTLLTVVLVAALFALATAWVVTRLAGNEIDEAAWRKIVDRSELLAQLPPPPHPPSPFDQLVLQAIDELPDEFQKVLQGVPVVVSDEGSKYEAYGLYVGSTLARGSYPDYIAIFQDTLLHDFGHNPELLRQQVKRVVRHELAHHLGWNEEGVRRLGL